MTKEIPLTQGKFAIVDDEDYEYLNQFKWCAHWHDDIKQYRAVRNNTYRVYPRTISMNRIIIGAGSNAQVDHINGNTLDNRRCNLRVCNNAENNRNRWLQSNNKSGYKGVCWNKKSKGWEVQIKVFGKKKHGGIFKSKVIAALKYDQMAKDNFGEFARINFPAYI